ncbi:hypothetical protein ACIRPK_17805 [Kitasatospora sp. NPDC101801]|uniref:hypothetical protein n=1 Tax=Kitasatospora sp. NPDC101801 TaxID=3364103 RepID=UPI003811D0A9
MNEEDGFRPNEFHHALDTELAALTAPALGDLVGLAAKGGRRKRRLRAAGAAFGSVTAVAALAVLVGSLGTGPAQSTVAGPAIGPAAAPASVAASPSAPATPAAQADPLVPVTAASLLDAVVKSLPAGLTADTFRANQAKYPIVDGIGYPAVFAYVNTSAGVGRISVGAFQSDPEEPACLAGTQGRITTVCSTSPAGDVVEVETNPTNCIQATRVTVHRPQNLGVAIDISSCLNWTNGQNPPAVPALTQEQAVALASSPLISTSMPSAFVAAANAKYPELPQPQ